MTTIIDKPKSSGELTYSNKGSCSRLVNYQISNKEKLGDDALFFNQYKDNLTPDEAKLIIDNNVKGLRANEEKFYSLSINPSNEELLHIGNDKTKFKDYVKLTMDNYALNFKDKGLIDKDLVWTAVIHDTRYYTHEDITKAERVGETVKFKIGDKKPGGNMHAHVIVSRRDSKMKQTLNIRGKGAQNKFSLFDLQKNNQKTFQVYFSYKNNVDLYKETQIKHIINEYNKVNNKMPLSEEKILKIAADNGYSGKIAYHIKSLQADINRGKIINDPYSYVELGKTKYNKEQFLEQKNKNEFNKTIENTVAVAVYEVSKFDFSDELNRDISRDEGPNLNDFNYRKRKRKKRNINL